MPYKNSGAESYRPRAASSAYWSKRYHTDQRVYVDGGVTFSDDITLLHQRTAPQLDELPINISSALINRFYERIESDETLGEFEPAKTWLRNQTDSLIAAKLDIAYEQEVIRARAIRCSQICAHYRTIAEIERFCEQHGISPPAITKYSTDESRMKRAKGVNWWTRKLFKVYTRTAENALRGIGFIARKRSLYASNIACRARRTKKEILEKWIDKTVALSSTGDIVPLRQIRDASTANPAQRRRELMTRLRGMDELGKRHNMVADFYTLTLPSKYHAVKADGVLNDKFNGSSVRDGQGQLRKLWTNVRARLAKRKIFYCGLRVAEPHHDGTGHWHMVLYSLPGDRDALRTMLTKAWLSEDTNEAGAQQHRITILPCDNEKGSAAGYLAKYVAKNIDGYEVGADLEASERDAADTSERVLTWAWLHGIRQFQFFGTARVGLWREFRRMRDASAFKAIEPARAAADQGKWSDFVDAIGGPFVRQKTHANLWKEITGEINQYDELAGPQIVGIACETLGPLIQVRTRLKVWRLDRSGSALGPVPITVTAAPELGEPRGWSNPQETSMYGPN